MTSDAIIRIEPLGFQWPTVDPFLFCVHHNDSYPAGNAALGPATSLAGRNIGMDFEGKDGWRMYHGDVVPGFPQHPHRGFETVTIVRKGLIDHSDSMGATARFGDGDVQWLTAGKGIVHAEMFPLLRDDAPNPAELFQIWLNLPAKNKMAEPHFAMLWNRDIPRHTINDDAAGTDVTIIAGAYDEAQPLAPPPASWAAQREGDVAIWLVRMDPRAGFTLPAAKRGTQRMLYFFEGTSVQLAGTQLSVGHAAHVHSDALAIKNGATQAQLLVLQGRPIGEPVAAHGPFVMNTRAELQQAFDDYQRTRFGGWPFGSDGPVHPRATPRHARFPHGEMVLAPPQKA